MHSFTLIARPARATTLVAIVGLLFAAQALLTLGGSGASGYVLVAAVAAATVAVGVFAPLHSRTGMAAMVTLRVGLALALVPVAGAVLTGWALWLPVLVAALCFAAVGMASLVRTRRDEGDIPSRLLSTMLAGTLLGIVLAPLGGGLVAGALWLAVAAALWAVYSAAPFTLEA
jgi:hypothetical protein